MEFCDSVCILVCDALEFSISIENAQVLKINKVYDRVRKSALQMVFKKM